jgi:membrane protease YdiL (CAAX protease family)
MHQLWRDRIFWVAVTAAIIFWGIVYGFGRPNVNVTWPLTYPWLFLISAIIGPILEEVVFRGLIQEYLAKRARAAFPGPISVSNLVTSVLFSAAHLIYHPPLWAAASFIPSLLFGYFKDKYQSLGPPMMLHTYYNSGYYLIFKPME